MSRNTPDVSEGLTSRGKAIVGAAALAFLTSTAAANTVGDCANAARIGLVPATAPVRAHQLDMPNAPLPVLLNHLPRADKEHLIGTAHAAQQKCDTDGGDGIALREAYDISADAAWKVAMRDPQYREFLDHIAKNPNVNNPLWVGEQLNFLIGFNPNGAYADTEQRVLSGLPSAPGTNIGDHPVLRACAEGTTITGELLRRIYPKAKIAYYTAHLTVGNGEKKSHFFLTLSLNDKTYIIDPVMGVAIEVIGNIEPEAKIEATSLRDTSQPIVYYVDSVVSDPSHEALVTMEHAFKNTTMAGTIAKIRRIMKAGGLFSIK